MSASDHQSRGDVTARSRLDLRSYTLAADAVFGRGAPRFAELRPATPAAALALLSLGTDSWSVHLAERDMYGLLFAMFAHGLVDNERSDSHEPAAEFHSVGFTLREARLARIILEEMQAEAAEERAQRAAERAVEQDMIILSIGRLDTCATNLVRPEASTRPYDMVPTAHAAPSAVCVHGGRQSALWRQLECPSAPLPHPVRRVRSPPYELCVMCAEPLAAFGALPSCVACFRSGSALLTDAMQSCEDDVNNWGLLDSDGRQTQSGARFDFLNEVPSLARHRSPCSPLADATCARLLSSCLLYLTVSSSYHLTSSHLLAYIILP